jgi:hypothetical protein
VRACGGQLSGQRVWEGFCTQGYRNVRRGPRWEGTGTRLRPFPAAPLARLVRGRTSRGSGSALRLESALLCGVKYRGESAGHECAGAVADVRY